MSAARPSRRPQPGDERGSLSMFLIVSLVGVMLGALLVPMVINSVRSTRFVSTRVQAVDVAQAGVDVALGKIRSAIDSGGLGDATELPCTPDGSPLTGDVGSATYSVTIDYFTVDPDKNTSVGEMLCVPGYGTYETTSGTAAPSYARLTSVGSTGPAVNGTTRGRTLVTTYVLQTSNTNIAGGVIRVSPASSSGQNLLCMDAGSATPAASVAIVLQGCSTSTPPAAQQTFAYRTDLTLRLVSSVTTSYPTGLCLDTAAPATAGSSVVLRACPAEGATPAYTQQWSYNDNGGYQASQANSSTTGSLPNLCLSVASQSAGVPLTLDSCSSATSANRTWIPAPSVGAGAAVSPQWVNASEFGRCLDVTNQAVGSDHLIDYPCKQNPYAGSVTWNQKFTPPTLATGATSATGQFYTTPNVRYCLQSPLNAGGYVTVKLCDTGLASQKWTVYTGDNTLPYSTKYTIVDSSGRCLGVTDPYGTETWSSIDVDSCDGSTSQKWNATPNLTASKLQNTREK